MVAATTRFFGEGLDRFVHGRRADAVEPEGLHR